MAYENIIYEKQDNIAVITFNRPEAMNALNIQTRAEFAEAARDVEEDENIKVLILILKIMMMKHLLITLKKWVIKKWLIFWLKIKFMLNLF